GGDIQGEALRISRPHDRRLDERRQPVAAHRFAIQRSTPAIKRSLVAIHDYAHAGWSRPSGPFNLGMRFHRQGGAGLQALQPWNALSPAGWSRPSGPSTLECAFAGGVEQAFRPAFPPYMATASAAEVSRDHPYLFSHRHRHRRHRGDAFDGPDPVRTIYPPPHLPPPRFAPKTPPPPPPP